MVPRKKLGELLLEAEAISRDDLLRALEEQAATGERLGSVMLRLRIIDAKLLAHMLGEQLDVEAVDFDEMSPTVEALGRVPADLALRWGCVPVHLDDSTLAVALVDPRDESVIAGLHAHTGLAIKRLVAPQSAIFAAIKRFYQPIISSLDIRELRHHLKNLKDDIARLEAAIG